MKPAKLTIALIKKGVKEMDRQDIASAGEFDTLLLPMRKRCHICNEMVDPSDTESGHCFEDTCLAKQNEDMECPECGGLLDDGHTEDFGQGYCGVYHGCTECGAEVRTS